jgi:homoaconitase/3-isopropylmalate dehydratase large subunit/3-isopropylmalate dehydratase small subunit
MVLVHDHTRAPDAYRGEDRDHVEALAGARDAFARRFGAEVIEGRGIQHHVLPATTIRPGMLVLGNDSHAPTLGAYGALAFAAQPTTVAAAIHTGTLVLRVPSTVRVAVVGRLAEDVSARDAALTLLALLRDAAPAVRVTGSALEFVGPGLANLGPTERAVLANVTPEAAAATATFPLARSSWRTLPRTKRPQAAHSDTGRLRDEADDGAGKATSDLEDDSADRNADVLLDLGAVRPALARSGCASDVVPISSFARTRVDRVFVGTCAGGTYEEIVAFAAVVTDRVAVPTVVAPATAAIEARLRDDGVLDRLAAAGVELLPPGCGPCFGFGFGRLEPGEVAVATANRNGVGRMGSPTSQVHLVAGASAGLAARTGWLGGGEAPTAPPVSFRSARPTVAWPRRGNVVRLHGTVTTDDLTPSVVPGVGTTSDRDPAVLRRLLLAHVAPDAHRRDLRGKVFVADHDFGMGSNRASAVRALRSAGVRAVIARSLAPLYAAGARDEGLPVIALDDDAFYRAIHPDTQVDIDLAAGVIRVGSTAFRVPPATPYEQALVAAGGVVAYLRRGA